MTNVQFIARLSGLPVSAVEELNDAMLSEHARTYGSLTKSIDTQRERISAILFEAVAREQERLLRNVLIASRRALFNGRIPSGAQLRQVRVTIPPGSREALDEYCGLIEARDATRLELKRRYAIALVETRRRFRQRIADARYQNGLLLSSATLFGNLERYRGTPPHAFDSRTEQIERGLLRYYTRVAMKATPFSTFCSVVPGEFLTEKVSKRTVVTLAGLPGKQTVHRRLNKALYGVLWQHLKNRPLVRDALAVEVNSTLQVDKDRWVFLAGAGSGEAFQRMPMSETVDLVRRVVLNGPEVTFGDVVDRLVREPSVEATSDEARNFMQGLIGRGFLRLRGVVAEQTADWDLPLIAFLRRVDDEHAEHVIRFLESQRVRLNTYDAAPASDRAALIATMREESTNALAFLGLSGASLRDLPFFEDVTADCTLKVTATAALEELLLELQSYVEIMLPLAHPRLVQMTMRQFFDKFYGDASAIPLLQFYEDFYRHHFKEHLELEQNRKRDPNAQRVRTYDFGNPLGLSSVDKVRRAYQRISSLFLTAWAKSPLADEVSVAIEEVRTATSESPMRAAEPTSATVFCQIVPPVTSDGPCRLMLPNGQFFPGFGKFFSRFLYILPDAIRTRALAANEAFADTCLAELCGDAHFNANLHPPLVRQEIAYPTSEAPAVGAPLNCTQLEVRRHRDDPNTLIIVDTDSARRVLPIDLGFLTAERRPPLFQLLTRFDPAGTSGLPLPEKLFNPGGVHADGTRPDLHRNDGESGGIIYRPRMVLGRLVLSRRRWTVPRELFPVASAGENPADYFERVTRWRVAAGIPEEVYARVFPKTAETSQAADKPPPAPRIPDDDGSPVNAIENAGANMEMAEEEA